MALAPVVLRLGVDLLDSADTDGSRWAISAVGSDGAVIATGTWSVASGAPLGGVCDEILGALDSVASRVEIGVGPGLVALDSAGQPVHAPLVGPSPSTEPDAGWLCLQLPGGADDWVAAVGAPPTAEGMLARLSWLHRSAPEAWSRLVSVATPAAWLVGSLTGRTVTSEADAAATGCWNPGGWRLDLLAIVDRDRDWTDALPAVADPDASAVGVWRTVPVVVV